MGLGSYSNVCGTKFSRKTGTVNGNSKTCNSVIVTKCIFFTISEGLEMIHISALAPLSSKCFLNLSSKCILSLRTSPPKKVFKNFQPPRSSCGSG